MVGGVGKWDRVDMVVEVCINPEPECQMRQVEVQPPMVQQHRKAVEQ